MLFESTPAEFPSAFNRDESVARLRAATRRSAFASLGEQAAVGVVAEDRVRLRRVIPMVRNSFQPVFVGRFEGRGGKLVLAGKFTMSPVVKAIMTVWFCMVGLFALAALFGGFEPRGPHASLFRLQPFLMICFGLGIVAAGQWFARHDRAWLSAVITEALGGPPAAVVRGGLAEAIGPPLVLKVAAGFLALTGCVSLLIGIFGFAMPPGTRPVLLPPAFSEAFGGAAIALAVGVWNRMRCAWRGGFGVLGVSLATSWFALPVSFAPLAAPAPAPVLRAIFATIVALITVVWARWWHAQRRHFR